jgi:hypothetical protein
MHQPLIVLVSIVALLHLTTATSRATDDHPVIVQLKDGTRLTGQMSASGDKHVLRLQTGTETTVLMRDVPWDSVRRISSWTSDALEQGAESGPIHDPHVRLSDAERAARMLWADEFVSTVRFVPALVDRDRDDRLDALLLRIYALDGASRTVSMRGVIRVTVLDQHGLANESLPAWTQHLVPEQLDATAVTITLPFRSHFSKNDLANCLVHIRADLGEQGMFESRVPLR